MDSVHHIWCPLSSQEFQDLPDGAETTLTERTATHIVTGAHGYETLCISGYIVEHNEMGEVIHNSEKLAEDLLPVTCPTCRVIWYHTHEFTLDDFDSLSGKGDFVVTDLKELNI